MNSCRATYCATIATGYEVSTCLSQNSTGMLGKKQSPQAENSQSPGAKALHARMPHLLLQPLCGAAVRESV